MALSTAALRVLQLSPARCRREQLHGPRRGRFRGRHRGRVFSYRAALLGRWDVFHVHWPESLLRHPNRRVRRRRRVQFALLVLRIVVVRAPVVRTVHNVRPHGRPTCGAVAPTPARPPGEHLRPAESRHEAAGLVPTVTIPHGHYERQLRRRRSWNGRPEVPVVLRLHQALQGGGGPARRPRATDDPALRLTVAGKPATDAMRAAIEEAARSDTRVDLQSAIRPRRRTERAHHCLVGGRPAISRYDQSGVVLAALSRRRPVLVQRNPVTLALRDEIGRLDHAVRPAAGRHGSDRGLERATARDSTSRPDLSGRSWPEVAARYADVYRALINDRRGRG